jgi:hypothetical protein
MALIHLTMDDTRVGTAVLGDLTKVEGSIRHALDLIRAAA